MHLMAAVLQLAALTTVAVGVSIKTTCTLLSYKEPTWCSQLIINAIICVLVCVFLRAVIPIQSNSNQGITCTAN